MSYTPTDWVDKVTPVDAAHMVKIEIGIDAAHDLLSGLADIARTGSYNSLLDPPDLSSLHSHQNKALLDSVTEVHNHANKTVLDNITEIHSHQNQVLLDSIAEVHTHANKAILDSVTNAHSHINIDTLNKITEFHTHTNKAVLDSVTEFHKHTNKAVLDTIAEVHTHTNKTILDSITAIHSHLNQAILDAITQEKITQWDAGGSGGGSSVTASTDNGYINVDGAPLKVYAHPNTHSADMLTDGTTNKVFTATDKIDLANLKANPSGYTHPATHSADMIVDGTNNKAYSAAERSKLASLSGTIDSVGVLWNAVGDVGVQVGDIIAYAESNTDKINNALNNAACPGLYFPAGIYRVGKSNGQSVVVPAGKSLIGTVASSSEGIATCFKPVSTVSYAVITARNAYGARIRNIFIHGMKAGGYANCHGLAIETSNPPPVYYNFGLEVCHIMIYHCGKSCLYIPPAGGTTGMNWVFHLYDMVLAEANEYALENHATDSTFEGMYLSGNGKGGLYAAGGNCMYSDIKIDYSGSTGWTSDMAQESGGAGLIINCDRSSFSNIDSQFSGHVGVKIYNSRKIKFSGSIDTTGDKNYNAAGGTDIAVINSRDVIIHANVDNINSNYYAQKQVNIDAISSNVYAMVPGATRVTNASPTSKVVTSPATDSASTSVQVLTQAEYDALGSIVNSNNVLYAIK